jgi:amino acid permease
MMLAINGLLAFLTSHMLVEAKRRFQVNEQYHIRTYADLGFAAFGWTGYIIVASLVFLNQFMTGICYALFFLQQLEGVLPTFLNNKKFSAFLLLLLLTPLSMVLRSMKNISYL